MSEQHNISPNVTASFSPVVATPTIASSAYIHPTVVVIGDVTIEENVLVSPMTSIRADEGTPFYIGPESNIQDGVVMHGLHTWHEGRLLSQNMKEVDGRLYSIFVGRRVSVAHQCHLHGPVAVMDNVFIGMQAFMFRVTIGRDCVIEPGCKIMGVDIPSGRYVPLGSIISEQSQADRLPKITEDYPIKEINKGVIVVNTELAKAYRQAFSG